MLRDGGVGAHGEAGVRAAADPCGTRSVDVRIVSRDLKGTVAHARIHWTATRMVITVLHPWTQTV